MSVGQLWSPEQVVTTEMAARLIEEQFPEFRCAQIEPFGEGWDNTAYVVDKRYVFRFPRREVAAELIHIEAECVPILVGN